MAGEYEKRSVLGSGTFGKAWLAVTKSTQKQCVLKEIKVSDMSKKEIDQTITEVTVLARCKHENIIRYSGAFVENGCLFIAMEYAEAGDIGKKIVEQRGIQFTEDVVLIWFVQINMALCYIHSRNILHRDLKPQNIFLTTENMIKLGDFGIARVLRDKNDLAMTVIGTPYYLSPEICQKQPYNHKSDMWALGCVLYELCCLRVPFSAPDFTSLVITILSGSFDSIPRHYGPLLEDLVSILLRTQPDSRPTSEQILCIPAMQPYVLEYTKNLHHAISEKKRRLAYPNIDILNNAKKEKREESCSKKHSDHSHDHHRHHGDDKPSAMLYESENPVDKEKENIEILVNDVSKPKVVVVDENQNEVKTDENQNDIVMETKKKDDRCTPEKLKSAKVHLDVHTAPPKIKTPENCCAASECYCVENPKIQREHLSPHMKDVMIKQRAAFSCKPGMKLNVGNQGIGPAPVFSMFSSVSRPTTRSESDASESCKASKLLPFSMAQELMARKNTNARSKSMSRASPLEGKSEITVSAPNGTTLKQMSRPKSETDLTDSNDSVDLDMKSPVQPSYNNTPEETSMKISENKPVDPNIQSEIKTQPTFKTPIIKESRFKMPGRKSSGSDARLPSTPSLGSSSSLDLSFHTQRKISPTNMNDSGCSEDDVFTTGMTLFKDPMSITPAAGTQRSVGSCLINSATFRVPHDKPRLSVPIVDQREECVVHDQNIRILYQATIESIHCKNRALTTLTLYLQEKLGAAFFQHLYALFKEAINTRMDHDLLKCRMRKSMMYLPLFIEIMRIEDHLPIISR